MTTKRLEETLKVRKNTYGDFTEQAELTFALKDTMHSVDGWARLFAYQKQALDIIMDKVSRILSGDPNYADNWHDIQGYAKLVEDRLPSMDSK